MDAKQTKIILPEECTIYEVAEWQQNIISQWSNHSIPLHFNLAKVNEMDASFVQLLLSCKKTAHNQGGSCILSDLSENVEKRLKQMHVYELLMEPDDKGETPDG